uniref:DUF1758 domain-containing protein n=1 Tax=Anopheles epiroticus TaxID=199890 RepID=A0A182PW06_9DIPT
MNFFTLHNITGDQPASSIPDDVVMPPRDMHLADPEFKKRGSIDLLLGQEVFYDVHKLDNENIQFREEGGLTFINTKFGWVVSGQVKLTAPNNIFLTNISTNMYCNALFGNTLEDMMERFRRIEEVQPASIFTPEEEECESNFKSNHYPPSSFLATRVLHQLADDEGEMFPLAQRALKADFYVDDYIGGAESDKEAVACCEELRKLLARGGFRLRKWVSNHPGVLHDVPSEDRTDPDSVNIEMADKWFEFLCQIPLIRNIQVPRYIFVSKVISKQLHCFSDAFKMGYGACVYVRTVDQGGRVRVELLAAKSRPSPLKRASIARLELCGALMAAKLWETINSALSFGSEDTIFWTDSTIVLHWVRAPSYHWATYVANRVSQIQEITKGRGWRHVKGVENPADIISRGVLPEELLKAEWWMHGPKWLLENVDQFSDEVGLPNVNPEILERKKVVLMTTIEEK